MDDIPNLVSSYFKLGLNNKEILQCLALIHGHVISIRGLKRIMAKLSLYRRKCHSDILEVALFVAGQCETPAQFNGYRWMHARCIDQGFVVTQDTVRLLLHIIDPENMDMRKKRRLKRRQYINPGPNAVWHIDGYDKLARYGIYIHGCVDGYSRRIMWLHAYYTNKDSKVIAGYFMDCILSTGKCPRRIRSDRGTEHVGVERMQKQLRADHTDEHSGDRSFIYGTSVTNQRIEWMWGLVRRQGMQYWINFFQQVLDEGHFTGEYVDKHILRFCFMNMIQVIINI